MSMHSPLVYFIPEDTAHTARASFPKVIPCVSPMNSACSTLMLQFAALFSATGQSASDPARLALITVFQFIDGLSDEQAA